jgi:hypothetical protein
VSSNADVPPDTTARLSERLGLLRMDGTVDRARGRLDARLVADIPCVKTVLVAEFRGDLDPGVRRQIDGPGTYCEVTAHADSAGRPRLDLRITGHRGTTRETHPLGPLPAR